MFTRSVIDNSRSIIDYSKSIIDYSRSIIDDNKGCSKLLHHSLTALEVSFMIIIIV